MMSPPMQPLQPVKPVQPVPPEVMGNTSDLFVCTPSFIACDFFLSALLTDTGQLVA